MMRSDVMKPIVAYETPRCITDYLELHQFKRDFSYLVSKMQSSDSRKLMKMLTEENRVSELAYRQALFNHRQRYQALAHAYFERNQLDAILYPTLPVLPCLIDDYKENGAR